MTYMQHFGYMEQSVGSVLKVENYKFSHAPLNPLDIYTSAVRINTNTVS